VRNHPVQTQYPGSCRGRSRTWSWQSTSTQTRSAGWCRTEPGAPDRSADGSIWWRQSRRRAWPSRARVSLRPRPAPGQKTRVAPWCERLRAVVSYPPSHDSDEPQAAEAQWNGNPPTPRMGARIRRGGQRQLTRGTSSGSHQAGISDGNPDSPTQAGARICGGRRAAWMESGPAHVAHPWGAGLLRRQK
jgi:hypothetical protein